jgi:penicillin-binding protein 1C
LPDCTSDFAADDGQAPQIVSPLRGEVYTKRVSRDGDERITFNATVDASVQNLYWFVDDGFVGSTNAREPLMWQPTLAGTFTLRAVDDHGRSDSRALRIDIVQ